MSESSYSPPPLTMGFLSIKLGNLFGFISSCRRQIFHSLDIFIYSHFIFQTEDIYQIVKFTLQPNSTKENCLAH